MKHETLSTRRTRIDDLSPIETVLSEESLESIFGGGVTLASPSSAPTVKSDVTFEGSTVFSNGGTYDYDAKVCEMD